MLLINQVSFHFQGEPYFSILNAILHNLKLCYDQYKKFMTEQRWFLPLASHLLQSPILPPHHVVLHILSHFISIYAYSYILMELFLLTGIFFGKTYFMTNDSDQVLGGWGHP